MRRTIPSAALVAALLSVGCAERTQPPDRGQEPEPTPGRAPAASGVEALALEARTTVTGSFPVRIRGTLSVRNTTDRTVQFDVGGCPVFLRIYDDEGAVVWDQGDGAVCTMILRTVTLAPGETETFETGTASATDILGEELPEGTYRAGVYLALVEGGQPEAPAGEVRLAVRG